MINFSEMKDLLAKFCSPSLAVPNDLVGVQVSLPKKTKITGIYLALDCTQEVIDLAKAKKANLILTHHPFLYGGRRKSLRCAVKKSQYDFLKKNKIAVYSMHTNYDEMFLKKDLLATIFPDQKILNHLPFVSDLILKKPQSLESIIKQICKKLQISNCHYFGQKTQKIKKITLSPGAAGFILKDHLTLKSDLYILGEMKWSNWLWAKTHGLSVIEIGHDSEEIFTLQMPNYLKKILALPKVTIPIYQHFFRQIKKCFSNDQD